MDLINFLPKDWILHRCVATHTIKYQKILLAYSGGLDSTVLLDILTTLRNINNNNDYLMSFPIVLRAAYVHHGLHQNSNIWAHHCHQQCKIRDVPFQVIYIDDFYKINNTRRNLEALARKFRYKKLFEYLNVEEILLTAHHMNDQVETLFLALKRGSGPAGLSSMDIYTHYHHQCKILRPLLECSKLQLKQYAISHNLQWVEDDTNDNIFFDRNFLRKKIIPILCKRWPFFNKVVFRTTEICRNQENLLKELLSDSLHKLIDVDNSLLFVPLLEYSILKRQAILRYWISNVSKNIPSYQFLHRMWEEVILSKKDATPMLQLGQYLYRRFQKKVYIIPVNMKFPINTITLYWNSSNNVIMLPHDLGLLMFKSSVYDFDFLKSQFISNKNLNFISNIFFSIYKESGKILTNCVVRSPKSDEIVSIRFGHVSGLLYIANRSRGRKLKKVWQEFKIPPWLRSRIPLLFYNNTLIAAIGVFITQDGKIDIVKKNIELRKIFWVQNMLYHKFFTHNVYHSLM